MTVRPHDNLCILLVDDQERNLFVLEKVLKDVPARLFKATSGDEALALALKHDFSLAILDVQMPGMDGYELAELLHGNPSTSGVPIIFVSAAFRDEAHRYRGYESGAVDYLVKPFDPVILLGKVKVFLELASTRAQLNALLQDRTRALQQKGEQLNRRNWFRLLVAELSRDLMRDAPPERARKRVAEALERVGTHIGADHGFLRYLDLVGRQGAEWSAVDGAAGSFRPALFEHSAFQHGHGVLLQGLEGLPQPLDRLQDELSGLGVGALLLLPIIDDVNFIGLIGFDWREGRREPPADLPELLAMVPDMVNAALMRVEAEASRQETQAQQRVLFETMTMGVVYQSAAGEILAVNAAAERILGATEDQLAGIDSMDPRWHAVHEDGSPFPGESHPAMEALRTGRQVAGVMMGVFNPREEGYRWIRVDAVPLFRPGESRPFQVYTTFSDLTDLKAAIAEQERLVRIEAESRAKSRFLASMSHEIRTPMNAVVGYTQLLTREKNLSLLQREYLDTISRSGRHLLTLINDVLDMARIEAGAERVEEEAADFADLLSEVEGMFRLRAAELGIAFRVVRAEDLPRWLRLDAVRVRQVLINLVGNAMKFTESGGVSLRAGAEARGPDRIRVVLEVEDTGIGIPQDSLETVFEPFVQVASGPLRSGTGLGLAVSRRFAQLMNGDISATSTLGRGSTFRFAFEAGRVLTEGGERPREQVVVGLAEGSAPLRVLVVEDDGDNRSMLVRMLDSVGLEVVDAATEEEGVARFAGAPCDIVLTDMRLPDGSGIGVMWRVRATPGGARVPVVAVSASALQQDRDAAFDAGIDGFLGKPVREVELFQEIARLTGARFILAEEGGDTEAGEALVRPSLMKLPPEQLASLAAALQGGYTDRIEQEVQALERAVPPAVGRWVRRAAEEFEFDRLLRVVEAGREV